MGNIKTLSEEELLRIAGINDNKYKSVLWHGREFSVLKTISVQEYLDTINSIIDMCSNEDGEILIEMLDFAIRVKTISVLSCVKLPENIDTLFRLVYSSDLYDVICTAAGGGISAAIRRAVFMRIGDCHE